MSAVIDAQHLAAAVKLPTGDTLSILKDVSLTVEEGSSAAIVGRSGSGKTTLLTLLGLMGRPDHGQLLIAGQSTAFLSDASAARLRNRLVGFVFQAFSLVDSLTVVENVEVPYIYGEKVSARKANQRAREMLELVGLASICERRVAQLSGGEQQRVAIARALVRQPSVILADEPTGSLDIETGETVLTVLRDAAALQGSCLVVVTHDQSVASQLDDVWELTDGTLNHQTATKASDATVIGVRQ